MFFSHSAEPNTGSASRKPFLPLSQQLYCKSVVDPGNHAHGIISEKRQNTSGRPQIFPWFTDRIYPFFKHGMILLTVYLSAAERSVCGIYRRNC